MGLQALREIRSNKKFSQIPVIVLTTSTLKKDRVTSYELGASCYLTKPDSFARLVELVDAVSTLWFF
jgi:DNA-binding response OmpR family regulator